MKKYLILILLITLLISGQAWAASTSSSYKITTEVLDQGAADATSAGYKLHGKGRELAVNLPTSAGYKIGEWFLRTAYGVVVVLPPIVTGISPNSGINTQTVSVAISGANFQAGAVVRLTRTGQSDIIATNVVVESATRITCDFNLIGVRAGRWDVVVTNLDGKSGTLPQGFEVKSPGIQVIGPIINDPNPFNPVEGPTTIRYTLTEDTDITLNLYNLRGERIWMYRAPAGTNGGRVGLNDVQWNGISSFGEMATHGVFILHVTSVVNGQVRTLGTGKIAVIR